MRRTLFVVASAAVIAAAACGISAVGEFTGDALPADRSASGGDGSSDSPVGTDDAGSGTGDAGTDALPSCDAPDASVLFLPPDGGTCPSGTTEATVHTAPIALAGACGCNTCTPTADPLCNTAAMTFTAKGDSSNACAQQTYNFNPQGDACTDFGLGTFNLISWNSYSARTPTGGTCTAAATTDPTKAGSTPLKACVASTPASACADAGAGERKCIESAGAPCGGEYPNAITIGDSAAVTCGACGCTRGAAKCVVDLYSDALCATASKYTQDADGICHQTNSANGVRYFKVHASGLTCNATPGAATATLVNSRTLCCAGPPT